MGIVHRASPEWKRLFKLRPTVERWFSSAKRSRLLDQHQYLGQDRVSLHARMSLLGYLLTSWGRLKAGDYAGMRQMHIRLPKTSPLWGDSNQARECGDCRFLPRTRGAGGVANSKLSSRTKGETDDRGESRRQ